MNIKELVKKIEKSEINENLVLKIESVYGKISNDFVKKLLSIKLDNYFIQSDDIFRVLTIDEIMNANKKLSVDFSNIKVIPFFDTGDNDYIVYHFDKNTWSFMNIVDCVCYSESAELLALVL